MQIVRDIQDWPTVKQLQFQKGSLGFVPTMGALHEGHLSLILRSIEENDHTVVSIFLNPTQFNEASDLANYPQTFDADLELLATSGVDVLLLPDYGQIYPDGYRYKLSESDFSLRLCGAARPGHFDGVLTVVLKLLNLVQASVTYFGEKDYQQFLLIKGMAEAFFLNTRIESCPTIRETDGLAFSSRNVRLTPAERNLAPQFYELLSSGMNLAAMVTELESRGFKVDYLEEIDGRRYGAVFLGKVRLIDNVNI